jgi:hypothetical protein
LFERFTLELRKALFAARGSERLAYRDMNRLGQAVVALTVILAGCATRAPQVSLATDVPHFAIRVGQPRDFADQTVLCVTGADQESGPSLTGTLESVLKEELPSFSNACSSNLSRLVIDFQTGQMRRTHSTVVGPRFGFGVLARTNANGERIAEAEIWDHGGGSAKEVAERFGRSVAAFLRVTGRSEPPDALTEFELTEGKVILQPTKEARDEVFAKADFVRQTGEQMAELMANNVAAAFNPISIAPNHLEQMLSSRAKLERYLQNVGATSERAIEILAPIDREAIRHLNYVMLAYGEQQYFGVPKDSAREVVREAEREMRGMLNDNYRRQTFEAWAKSKSMWTSTLEQHAVRLDTYLEHRRLP